jgi:secreted Zn-dependent insulinase-like peptidase
LETGSLQTLNKPDIREVMIDFFKKYYTSDNISICIASSINIKEQIRIITNTFGNIKETKCIKFELIKPFYTENMNKTFHIKSISNIYKLTYLWEIPIQSIYMYSKDFYILGLMITEKSELSLYKNLKNKGYINNINFEIDYEGVFTINIMLTKTGLDSIQYIEMMLLSTIHSIYNTDIKEICKIFSKNYTKMF